MTDTLSNAEALEMMRRCKNEIEHLRSIVGALQPKADAYDMIATILRLLPQPSRGAAPDVIWALERRIRELTADENKAPKS